MLVQIVLWFECAADKEMDRHGGVFLSGTVRLLAMLGQHSLRKPQCRA